MKRSLSWFLVVLLLLAGVGIGCDGDQSAISVDLTADREILTSFTWVAEKHYEVTDGSNTVVYASMDVNAYDDNNFQATVYSTGDASGMQDDMARITYTDDVPTFQGLGGSYALRITATEESLPVLSLTGTDGEKMYFSPLEMQ